MNLFDLISAVSYLLGLPSLMLVLWHQGIAIDAMFTPPTKRLQLLMWIGIVLSTLWAVLYLFGVRLTGSVGVWGMPLAISLCANAVHAIAHRRSRRTVSSEGTSEPNHGHE